LKILHISHESLPDRRVEKSAITGINHGHEVSFAGSKISDDYNLNTFASKHEIIWSAKARYGIPVYWHTVKKVFEKILRSVKPDVVHAHNIFSAKMVSELGTPFVYDDHEYWSKSAKALYEIEDHLSGQDGPKNIHPLIKKLRSYKRKYVNKKVNKLWSKWERDIVSSHPTITVSNAIADELKLFATDAGKIYVVPNFPLRIEVKDIGFPTRQSTLSSVYAGGDGYNKIIFPQKNIEGFVESFGLHDIGILNIIGWQGNPSPDSNVIYFDFLPRQSMFSEMSRHSIGLIPWKAHWLHRYSSPNKAYEYAHSGLFVMCSASLKPVIEYLEDNCMTFENYGQMVSELKYFKENLNELYAKRVRIFDFARSNLLWEKYDKNIISAYQMC
jgi:glycosyltransferase involved in cell wall biosynthesis